MTNLLPWLGLAVWVAAGALVTYIVVKAKYKAGNFLIFLALYLGLFLLFNEAMKFFLALK